MMKAYTAAILSLTLAASGCDRQRGAPAQGNAVDQATAETGTPAAVPPATTSPVEIEKVSLEVRSRDPFGAHLTDASGRTLYVFSRDQEGVSNCQGRCLQDWPPLLQKGAMAAGSGVDEAKIGTIVRDSGLRQVTYAGRPLYYYVAAQSTNPGSVQGIRSYDGQWHLVSPEGVSIETPRPS